jgi:hypothetical protein
MNRMLTILLVLSGCAVDGSGTTLTKDEVRSRGKADEADDHNDAFDYCDALHWYGDGVCDDFCLNRDPDCATDDRTPELGGNPAIARNSQIKMSQALTQAEAQNGVTIEAKFELDDAGKLSLSVYPIGQPITFDAERNVFQELSGDPTVASWTPSLEVFHDQEHLTRSARDLTLVQLSRRTLRDVVGRAEPYGRVYWAIPTIQEGRAGYGMYLMRDGVSRYVFIDGAGSARRQVIDLGSGPGAGATDARVPELGSDVTIVRQSRISMSAALRQIAPQYGAAIEAKFELDDSGHLSLSIYPVGHGIGTDSERNTFFELAGDPTAATFAPSLSEFTVPDEEHLTRSSRDLTLVQTARLPLLDAVTTVEGRFPGAFVFWAIPTIRDTRSGYGIYVLATDGTVHYVFVS